MDSPRWVRLVGYSGCILSSAILFSMGNFWGGMWALVAFINQWTAFAYFDLLKEKTENSDTESP